MKITAAQDTAMRAHAIAEYPRESCGVIKDGHYTPMVNVSEDPFHAFRLASRELASMLPIEAVVHSHPDGPNCPSAADMRSQAAMAVPFVILCSDGVAATEPFILDPAGEPPPLESRPFRYGVTDCYALIRDWYRLERTIVLPDYPRDWEWWDGESPDNLYMDNYAEWGFRPLLDAETPVRGDVFLIKTPRAKTVNHGGIYLGDGLGLHHLTATYAFDANRIPHRIPINRWQSLITLWLRYEGATP